jgi:hypothetical protein
MTKLVYLVFICVSLHGIAQGVKETNFGVKLGYNNSNISGKDSNGEATGYFGNELYLGLFVDKQLTNKTSLQLELIYSFTEDYNFLEIPLNIKYKVYRKLYLFAGPKFDFILDNDISEANYEYRNFGVSADLGVQYLIAMDFFAEVRYSIGFEEQLKRDIQLDINNATRNTFRIGIGYRF